MSQAIHAHITTRACFAPAKRRPSPSELALAFTALQTAIGGFEQPYEPKVAADAADVEEWAEHLNDVLQAAATYARAVVTHLDEVTPGGVADETSGLADAASEVVAALRNAAESRRLDHAA